MTSGVAAPAYAGIPVPHRNVATSVTFVTGHEDPKKGSQDVDWDRFAAQARRSHVVLPARSALRYLVDTLQQHPESLLQGKPEPKEKK